MNWKGPAGWIGALVVGCCWTPLSAASQSPSERAATPDLSQSASATSKNLSVVAVRQIILTTQRTRSSLPAKLRHYFERELIFNRDASIETLEAVMKDSDLDYEARRAIKAILKEYLIFDAIESKGLTLRLPELISISVEADSIGQSGAQVAYYSERNVVRDLDLIYKSNHVLSRRQSSNLQLAFKKLLGNPKLPMAARAALRDLSAASAADFSAGRVFGATLWLRSVEGRIGYYEGQPRDPDVVQSDKHLKSEIIGQFGEEFALASPAMRAFVAHAVVRSRARGDPVAEAFADLQLRHGDCRDSRERRTERGACSSKGQGMRWGGGGHGGAGAHGGAGGLSRIDVPDCSTKPPDPRCPTYP
jgi:hypothetical protein